MTEGLTLSAREARFADASVVLGHHLGTGEFPPAIAHGISQSIAHARSSTVSAFLPEINRSVTASAGFSSEDPISFAEIAPTHIRTLRLFDEKTQLFWKSADSTIV